MKQDLFNRATLLRFPVAPFHLKTDTNPAPKAVRLLRSLRLWATHVISVATHKELLVLLVEQRYAFLFCSRLQWRRLCKIWYRLNYIGRNDFAQVSSGQSWAMRRPINDPNITLNSLPNSFTFALIL